MATPLFRSTTTVSVPTLLSRVTGLVRDVAFARFLGSGLEADVFFVAFRIPSLFRRIFGEGALPMSFIPVFAGIHAAGGDARTRAFVAAAGLFVLSAHGEREELLSSIRIIECSKARQAKCS